MTLIIKFDEDSDDEFLDEDSMMTRKMMTCELMITSDYVLVNFLLNVGFPNLPAQCFKR